MQSFASRKCLYPVLPAKLNEKVIFALFPVCAVTKNQKLCKHGDEERGLKGVWTVPELIQAVDVGYKICEMYVVWHWEDKKKGLFTKYINLFLNEKIEASGCPTNIDTNKKKDNSIAEVLDKEDIQLNQAKMEKQSWTKSCN